MFGNQPAANHYRETAIKTANPLQLVVMLYEGAIHSLQQAQEHVRRKEIASRLRCVNRAVSIISELHSSLNLKEGSDIANSLDRLYAYMKQRIIEGNIQQNSEPLAEVVSLLENLRSAWSELERQSQFSDTTTQKPGFDNNEMLGTGTTGDAGISGINISG